MKHDKLPAELPRGAALGAILLVLIATLSCSDSSGGSGSDSAPSPDDDATTPDDDSGDDGDDDDDDNDITPAEADDDAWPSEDIVLGGAPAFVISEDGDEHLAYTSWQDSSLVYGQRSAGDWIFQTAADRGWQPSLAVDGNGTAHIAFMLEHRALYATNNGGAWESGTIKEAIPGDEFVSITVDNTGRPEVGVAWSDDPLDNDDDVNVIQEVDYAVLGLEGWQFDEPYRREGCTHPGYNSLSVRVDSQGCRRSAFYSYSLGALQYLAECEPSSWTEIAGSESGQLSAMVLDGEGRAHLAYGGRENWLRYETYADGEWRGEYMVELGVMALKPAIAIDANGHAHIAYRHAGAGWNYDLRYVTNASGRWVYSVIDDLGGYGALDSPNVALDPDGYVHIVYAKYPGSDTDAMIRHAVSPEPYGASQ